MKNGITSPHGNRLVNLVAGEARITELKARALSLDEIVLSSRQLCDFDMLATGVFSPLTGFMGRSDYDAVVKHMRLATGELFPLPVCLDVPRERAKTLAPGQSAALRDQEGLLLAVMHITDVWQPDREQEALAVYGTTDCAHPGVHHLLKCCGEYYVGGTMEVVQLPVYLDSRQLRKSPAEVRDLYRKLSWHRVIGFHTRQPIHRL
ncbi:MAG: adenylyltransferase, partial [Thermodesulfobacteriota bacterium]